MGPFRSWLGYLGQNVIKLLRFLIYEFFNKLECFSLAGFFQPRLMLANKAGDYMSEAPFRYSIQGTLSALSTNVRQAWKSMVGTNTLAYYKIWK